VILQRDRDHQSWSSAPSLTALASSWGEGKAHGWSVPEMLLCCAGKRSDGGSPGKGRWREALLARCHPLPFPELPYHSHANLPLPQASHC